MSDPEDLPKVNIFSIFRVTNMYQDAWTQTPRHLDAPTHTADLREGSPQIQSNQVSPSTSLEFVAFFTQKWGALKLQ